MKLIDLDAVFNRAMERELIAHAGERTEEEWERAIAEAYAAFGRTPLKELGKTPVQYFAEMGDAQLCETLKEYILQGVPVPDFLSAELSSRGAFPELLALLNETDEELVLYALDALGADRRALPRYAEMLGEEGYDAHVKDHLAELLKERADEVVEPMLALAKGENAPYALEVLSKVSARDGRVFDALLSAFRGADEEELPLYAGYLASYGDERALPALLAEIEREDVGFVAFQELKYAIEALGGEYEKERDFSSDEAYKTIMAATAGADIFGRAKRK